MMTNGFFGQISLIWMKHMMNHLRVSCKLINNWMWQAKKHLAVLRFKHIQLTHIRILKDIFITYLF